MIVKHSDNDYREHQTDGTETGRTWTTKPSRSDVGEEFVYRDVTIDGETVPWQA